MANITITAGKDEIGFFTRVDTTRGHKRLARVFRQPSVALQQDTAERYALAWAEDRGCKVFDETGDSRRQIAG